MDIAEILEQLRGERNRVNAAILALEGLPRRSGGRPATSASKQPAKGRGRLSTAARKRLSEVAKVRWAKAKKAGRNAL